MDRILLTEEVLKWYRLADRRLSELFMQRLRQVQLLAGRPCDGLE
jgi:hypothetical protein